MLDLFNKDRYTAEEELVAESIMALSKHLHEQTDENLMVSELLLKYYFDELKLPYGYVEQAFNNSLYAVEDSALKYMLLHFNAFRETLINQFVIKKSGQDGLFKMLPNFTTINAILNADYYDAEREILIEKLGWNDKDLKITTDFKVSWKFDFSNVFEPTFRIKLSGYIKPIDADVKIKTYTADIDSKIKLESLIY